VRAYIRHPSEFPIELRSAEPGMLEAGGGPKPRLLDVSAGGLCCLSKREYAPGSRIMIHIPVGDPPFSGEGTVAWCRPQADRFRVGIAFDDLSLAFSARMVEQVCHIGRYHKHLQEQGREVSEEEAALEWIGKYAKLFPR
jgi:hypothetical protein